ncbi:MAG: transposase [Smithella sp.]
MNFIPSDRKTCFSPSEKWLQEGNLARIVVEIVEQLNFRSLHEFYPGQTPPSYSPAMLTALLFYGYVKGVFSSRKLERSTYDSVDFQYISANTHPDYNTIAGFRRQFSKELFDFFVQILMIASLMGILTLDELSPEGSKIKMNALRRKALSCGYACEFEEQIKAHVTELLRKAEAADHADLTDGHEVLKCQEIHLAAMAGFQKGDDL